MAKHPCKGTVLKIEIATVMTAITQLVSIDVPENEPETYDAHTLDQTEVDMHKGLTGYVGAGDITAEGFFDTGNAAHRALHDLSADPEQVDGQIELADVTAEHATATLLEFTAAAVKVGFAVKMNDGLKAKLSLVLDGPTTMDYTAPA